MAVTTQTTAINHKSMAKVKQKSESERAIELAVDQLRSTLIMLSDNQDLKIEIEVRGMKLSKIAEIVEANEVYDLIKQEGVGIDRASVNYYSNLKFHNTEVCLNTLNEI